MVSNCLKLDSKNYNGGMVTYKWQYTLSWKLPTRSNHYTYRGTTTADGSTVTSWTVPFSDIFRGGVSTLVVTATTTDGKTYTSTVSPNSVLGDNPSIAEATQGVSRQMQVVMFLESSFRQFETNRFHGIAGYPLYGPPNGYGIAMPDPVPNDQDLWNWIDNRQVGQSRLNQKDTEALGYPARVRRLGGSYKNATNFTDLEHIWKETFQRYNGGNYWIWAPVQEDQPSGPWMWKESYKALNNGYGDRAWNLYLSPTW